MRADVIVLSEPRVDDDLGLTCRREPLRVEHLAARRTRNVCSTPYSAHDLARGSGGQPWISPCPELVGFCVDRAVNS